MRWMDSSWHWQQLFEWHDWFAWYPIRNQHHSGQWVWLETIRRKRIAVGPQGLTGNYEWIYDAHEPQPREEGK